MLYRRNLLLQLVVMQTAISSYQLSKAAKSTDLSKADKLCVSLDNLVMKNINRKLAACEDFYEYVCDKTESFSKISSIQFATHNKLIYLLEKVSNKSPEYQIKLKNLYNACVNLDTPDNLKYLSNSVPFVNKFSFKELLTILDSLGGWPVTKGSEWNASNFQWTEVIPRLTKLGFLPNYLLEFKVTFNPFNTRTKIIEFDAPKFSEFLIQSNLQHYQNIINYANCMMGIALALGANEKTAREDIDNVVKFEIFLANYVLDQNSLSANIVDFNFLKNKYNKIDWLTYVNDIVSPILTFEPTDEINIRNLAYFNIFYNTITSEKVPARTIANYIFWRAIYQAVEYIPEKIGMVNSKCTSIFQNDDSYNGDKIISCLNKLKSKMHMAINGLYEKNYKNNHLIAPVRRMAQKIYSSFLNIVTQTDEYDEKIKQHMIKKMLNMKIQVSYPKKYIGNTFLNNFYANLFVTSSSYLSSSLNLNLFFFQKKLEDYREHNVDWIFMHDDVPIFTPIFLVQNILYIPVSSLNEYLFNPEFSDFFNYARYGQFIGSAIAHSFDFFNQIYDETGQFITWWYEANKEKVDKNIQCMKYRLIKKMNSSSNELVQNVLNFYFTEYLGLKAAYEAYVFKQKWASRPDDKCTYFKTIFNLSEEQVFWIYWASMWCQPKTISILLNYIMEPARIHVLMSVSNLNEFAKDFNCTLGQFMHPFKKCPAF